MREPITALELYSLRACEEDVEKFERMFPDGCEITPRNAKLCGRKGLDVSWVAAHMLDDWQAYDVFFEERENLYSRSYCDEWEICANLAFVEVMKQTT